MSTLSAAFLTLPLTLTHPKTSRFRPSPSLSSQPNSKNRTGSPSLRCDAQFLADVAPIASAAYGTLLLGGGLFACNNFSYVSFFIFLLVFLFEFYWGVLVSVSVDARSGSKGSILGGLSGAALMAAVSSFFFFFCWLHIQSS